MNIFVLNKDPVFAARNLCDKHIVKMPLETAQILSTAVFLSTPGLYKPSYQKHPCVLWASKTFGNFIWLYRHGKALCEEYTNRYGKIHKSQSVIELAGTFRDILPKGILTTFAQCMPEQYKQKSAIKAYRDYYLNDKAYFAKWNYSDKPKWWTK